MIENFQITTDDVEIKVELRTLSVDAHSRSTQIQRTLFRDIVHQRLWEAMVQANTDICKVAMEAKETPR